MFLHTLFGTFSLTQTLKKLKSINKHQKDQFEIYHHTSREKLATLAFNTSRPEQNGRHFADDIFKCIFLNENVWIPIKISLKFVPKGPINNIPALVPVMVRLLTHICVTRPQWVKPLVPGRCGNDSKNVWYSKLCYGLSSWAFLVKLLLDECQWTPLMRSQYWFG